MINILKFSISLSYTGPKILLHTFLSKMFICFLSFFLSIQVSDAYVLSIIVFFSLNFSFSDKFLFLKNVYTMKYVLLAFFIHFYKSVWWLLSSLGITPRYLKFSSLNIYNFILLIVLFYFVLSCFSVPLSYIFCFSLIYV